MNAQGYCQVPPIPQEQVVQIITREFGIIPENLKRQESYDDLTYRIKVKEKTNACKIGDVWPDGYIFKVTNPQDSQNVPLIDGQVSFLLHMRSKGINAPAPAQNVDGTYWKFATFQYTDAKNNVKEISLIVRLFKFLSGELLCAKGKYLDTKVFYDLGKLAAEIHDGTKDFHHSVFDTHQFLWGMEMVPKAKEFINVYPDEKRRNLAKNVIQKFEEQVLAHLNEFERGQIHGDLNEHNLLLHKREGTEDKYDLTGVIDLWDTQYTCLLFDLALAIVYMMAEEHNIPIWDVGGHILAGYESKRKLKEMDLKAIPTSMAARMAQSVILGYHTYNENPTPSNEYVLFTQKKGWHILEELSKKTDEQIISRWKEVMATYQT